MHRESLMRDLVHWWTDQAIRRATAGWLQRLEDPCKSQRSTWWLEEEDIANSRLVEIPPIITQSGYTEWLF